MKKKGKIVIFGDKSYTDRIFRHLLKEHPSTRKHMIRSRR